jgi:hypothetical protein
MNMIETVIQPVYPIQKMAAHVVLITLGPSVVIEGAPCDET